MLKDAALSDPFFYLVGAGGFWGSLRLALGGGISLLRIREPMLGLAEDCVLAPIEL